jgi:hypothetical protein
MSCSQIATTRAIEVALGYHEGPATALVSDTAAPRAKDWRRRCRCSPNVPSVPKQWPPGHRLRECIIINEDNQVVLGLGRSDTVPEDQKFG